MKLILENWRQFIKEHDEPEEKRSPEEQQYMKDRLLELFERDPETAWFMASSLSFIKNRVEFFGLDPSVDWDHFLQNMDDPEVLLRTYAKIYNNIPVYHHEPTGRVPTKQSDGTPLTMGGLYGGLIYTDNLTNTPYDPINDAGVPAIYGADMDFTIYPFLIYLSRPRRHLGYRVPKGVGYYYDIEGYYEGGAGGLQTVLVSREQLVKAILTRKELKEIIETSNQTI